MARQSLMGQGILIIEASRLHSDTPQSVGLLWTGDQPETETSTWQYTTLTTTIHVLEEIRTRNPSKRAGLGTAATQIGTRMKLVHSNEIHNGNFEPS